MDGTDTFNNNRDPKSMIGTLEERDALLDLVPTDTFTVIDPVNKTVLDVYIYSGDDWIVV